MATTPAFLLLLLAMAAFRGSDGAWCVCRSDATDTALQKTLDYACGHGADCAAVLPTGPCYSPTSVQAHCSYAANSYFQRNSQANGATACDFGGTANLTDTDPSSGTCKYPATPSEAGTSGGNSTGAGRRVKRGQAAATLPAPAPEPARRRQAPRVTRPRRPAWEGPSRHRSARPDPHPASSAMPPPPRSLVATSSSSPSSPSWLSRRPNKPAG